MKRFWSANTLAVCFLAIFPWLMFWQAALGIFGFAAGDLSSFFYPVRLQLARALAEGRLPLWEPGMGAGFPLFAEGQVAALYPPNLILFRLLPTPLALSWSILAHLSWAAIGMYVFARASGLRVSSATLAGFVFSFSGFFLAHVAHVSLIATASWIGWILFLQNQMLAARRNDLRVWRVWFALTGLALGSQLVSGFPQIALFNLIVFVAVGLFEAVFSKSGDGSSRSTPSEASGQAVVMRAWKPALLVLVCIILGLLIGAVQLLPTAELAALSTRGAVGEKFFTSYSLELSDLPQFFSPFTTLGEPFTETQEFWGFIGVGTFLLALSALAFKRDARTYFLAAIALVALALALGGNNPVYSALYAIPIFNRFRVPARFLFLFSFAMIYLGAIGFDELQNRLRDSERGSRPALWVAVPIGFATAAIFIARNALGRQLIIFAWEFLPWIFLFATLGLVALAWRRIVVREIFATAVLGATVLELSLFSLPFLFGLAVTIPTSLFTAAPPVIRAMDATQPLARVWTNSYAPDIRPNRPMAYGKPAAQIYSPLALESNAEYLSALSPAMLNLTGIRYVIEPVGAIPDTATVPTSTLPIDFLHEKISIPATRVARVEIVSFTNGTPSTSDGAVMGEVTLSNNDGITKTIPIKLGADTAEWNIELIRGAVKHSKPASSQKFVASLGRQGNTSGEKFVARYDLPAPMTVTQIAASSSLKNAALTIDQIVLYDDSGKSFSAMTLVGLNDYALAEIDDGGVMYENRSAMPRAFIVHRAELADDADVIAKMSAAEFQPDRVAYLAEGEALNRSAEFDAARVVDQVSVIEYRPERVTIRAKTVEPGYLILTDSWYPGWVANVDGTRAPGGIDRADFIFRAVKLSAGEHTVVFEYQPASLLWGAALSAVGLITVLGLIVQWKIG